MVLSFILPPGDEELVREVLLDAVVTAPMEAYWTALALNASEYVWGRAEGSEKRSSSNPQDSLGCQGPSHYLADSSGDNWVQDECDDSGKTLGE